jgi:hypothetical protein
MIKFGKLARTSLLSGAAQTIGKSRPDMMGRLEGQVLKFSQEMDVCDERESEVVDVREVQQVVLEFCNNFVTSLGGEECTPGR